MRMSSILKDMPMSGPEGSMTVRADSRSVAAVLLVVALLAALHLRYPLEQDQAMFMTAARELADGARMYRDYWDMKQPGIYWWYQAAGSMFGFDAPGLRWMDLLWSLAVGWMLWAALRSRGTLAAVLGACLAFATFYGRSSQWHLSQVEWLVCGPIVVVLWCVAEPAAATGGPRRLDWRYALAGAMVALTGVFKTMAALIPLAMLAVDLLLGWRQEGRRWRTVAAACGLPLLAGAAVVLLPIAAWMARDGTLGVAIWTAFVYPPQAVREYAHNSPLQFIQSLRWFLVGIVTVFPWALWGAWNGLRHGRRIELLCVAWGLAALAVIGMQLLSYWEYHFDLMFIPAGVLAALGFVDVVDRLAAPRWAGPRRLAVAAMALCLLLVPGLFLLRKTEKVLAAMPFTPAGAFAFDLSLDPALKNVPDQVALVRRLTKPSDRIIVWGDPRWYAFVGRRPVVQVDGATFYLAQQVIEVADLIRRDPPPMIYLSKLRDRMTYHADGVLPRTVRALYLPVYEDDRGIWYQRRSDAAKTADDAGGG